MKRDATHNVCNSAATSPEASDPLAGELAVSRAAIARELDEIRTRLRKSADPHDLVGRHPWLAIAAISACGFVAATVVVPARSRRLAAQPVHPSRKASTESPWWVALVSRLLDVLKLVIERLLPTVRSGITPRETAESVDRDGPPGSTRADPSM